MANAVRYRRVTGQERAPHAGILLNEPTEAEKTNFATFHQKNGLSATDGTAHGRTDELGANAVVNPVSVHDIHATLIHPTRLDHEKLIVDTNGVDRRLTDVHGHVMKTVLA